MTPELQAKSRAMSANRSAEEASGRIVADRLAGDFDGRSRGPSRIQTGAAPQRWHVRMLSGDSKSVQGLRVVRARIAGDLGDTGRVDLRAKVRNLGRLPISSIGWGRLLSASAFALSDVREHTAAPTNLRPKKSLPNLEPSTHGAKR
jgi:hypothetical protein